MVFVILLRYFINSPFFLISKRMISNIQSEPYTQLISLILLTYVDRLIKSIYPAKLSAKLIFGSFKMVTNGEV